MPEILQWWNLVYVLSFGLALLYAALISIGLVSSSADIDADVDADVDVDADIDVDADVDLDVDADIGADVDVDADVDADLGADVDADADAEVGHGADAIAAHYEPSLLDEALSFLGVGRVPLSILMMTFLTVFSLVGWFVNTALTPVLTAGGHLFLASLPAALVCGVLATKLLVRTLGRWLKPIETAAVRRSNLVGRIAVASLPVTDQFGQALAYDQYGTQHKVVCKVAEGAETIPKGRSILLVRFVRTTRPGRRQSGYYLVEPYDVPREGS